jgi:preprotein translocase subunit YajC
MLTSLLVLLAADPAPDQSPLQSIWSFAPFIGIFVIGYFLLWRPMKRQEAERQAMLSKMKKNDEILTTGGIYGTIIEVSDKEDKIIVKIADNVRVKITKAAIARNLTNEEEAAKAKQPATKEGAA